MVLLSMRRSLCVGEDNFKRKENHSLDKRKESSILLATDGEELLALGGLLSPFKVTKRHWHDTIT